MGVVQPIAGRPTCPDAIILASLAAGLPIDPHPYRAIAQAAGLSEQAVVKRIRELRAAGDIKRFGIIVRHHELGYRANGMTVWDVPDERVADVGRRLASHACVTLSYRRPRRPPDWPYNLFTMVHGADRAAVLQLVEELAAMHGLKDIEREILFSTRRYKQCGARFFATPPKA